MLVLTSVPTLHPAYPHHARRRRPDRALERAGVDTVFGIPGGACLPIYDALHDSAIRHVLMRHEAAAGHAAEGYARATGRVGVALGTSGPGATNLVTPIADARWTRPRRCSSPAR